MIVTSYYPWNTQALSDWIRFELSTGKTPMQLANGLQIPQYVLREWRTLPAASITLEQIQLIACYRGWDFQRTIKWLGIRPAHLEELMKGSASQNGIEQSFSDYN